MFLGHPFVLLNEGIKKRGDNLSCVLRHTLHSGVAVQCLSKEVFYCYLTFYKRVAETDQWPLECSDGVNTVGVFFVHHLLAGAEEICD